MIQTNTREVGVRVGYKGIYGGRGEYDLCDGRWEGHNNITCETYFLYGVVFISCVVGES